MKQMAGDGAGALDHAVTSLNLLAGTLFGILSEDNRRELRQLTADTHHVSAYFGLPDDVDWCDEYDLAHA